MNLPTCRNGKHNQVGANVGLVGVLFRRTEPASAETLNFPVFSADSAVTFPPRSDTYEGGLRQQRCVTHRQRNTTSSRPTAQLPAYTLTGPRRRRPFFPGNQTRIQSASPDHSTEQRLTIRLSLSSSRCKDASAPALPASRKTVIGGRRSACDGGGGASKPGHASGTRRHLMGRRNMVIK